MNFVFYQIEAMSQRVGKDFASKGRVFNAHPLVSSHHMWCKFIP